MPETIKGLQPAAVWISILGDLITEALMAGGELLEAWKRGNTEKESCVEKDRESQPHKKLTHSIEEILRRPTCVKSDTGAHRNWSVITENTRIWNQLSRGGTCFFYNVFPARTRLKHYSKVNQ